jgi:hypothetical protein
VGKSSGTAPASLPPGVVLSARSVAVAQAGIVVQPALAAFGGLFNKLFPSTTNGGPLCLLSTIAAIYGAQLQLDAFRRFRDATLLTSASGRQLASLYYEHGAEVAALLARESEICRRFLSLSERVNEALRGKYPLLTEFENDARILIDLLVAKGSPSLGNAAQALLASGALAGMI